jgi:hypothetical protein
MKCGIIGLPNVGKSTMFNAITKTSDAAAENYPFCTIDPNIAIVPIQDARLDKIARVAKSAKTIYVTLQCYDIAGLVRGAHSGEGRGNSFLSHIKEVDLLIHVVRVFQDPNIIHVDNTVNPSRDVETIDLELIYADLAMLQKTKSKAPEVKRAIEYLDQMIPLRNTDIDREALRAYPLLSLKPVIYALNVDPGQELPKLDGECVAFSADVEYQISQITDPAERAECMEMYGMQESGLNRLLHSAYKTLDLVTYFTAGEQEARGWTVRRDTSMPDAAGVIHTDMRDGFIKAEVVKCDDFISHGGWVGSKGAGVMALKGKADKVQDGDVCMFRFNV